MKPCVIVREGRAKELNADFYQVEYCGSVYNIWHAKYYFEPEIYRVVGGLGEVSDSITGRDSIRDGLNNHSQLHARILKALCRHNRDRLLEDCLSEHLIALYLRDKYNL